MSEESAEADTVPATEASAGAVEGLELEDADAEISAEADEIAEAQDHWPFADADPDAAIDEAILEDGPPEADDLAEHDLLETADTGPDEETPYGVQEPVADDDDGDRWADTPGGRRGGRAAAAGLLRVERMAV